MMMMKKKKNQHFENTHRVLYRFCFHGGMDHLKVLFAQLKKSVKDDSAGIMGSKKCKKYKLIVC
jgi:hypothetical protein